MRWKARISRADTGERIVERVDFTTADAARRWVKQHQGAWDMPSDWNAWIIDPGGNYYQRAEIRSMGSWRIKWVPVSELAPREGR